MDIILFHHEGGVDIGDVDSKALKLEVPVADVMEVNPQQITSALLTQLKGDKDLVARWGPDELRIKPNPDILNVYCEKKNADPDFLCTTGFE